MLALPKAPSVTVTVAQAGPAFSLQRQQTVARSRAAASLWRKPADALLPAAQHAHGDDCQGASFIRRIWIKISCWHQRCEDEHRGGFKKCFEAGSSCALGCTVTWNGIAVGRGQQISHWDEL